MRYLTKEGYIMPDFKKIAFEDFYQLYPRKVSRHTAKKSFNKLSKRDKMLAHDGLINYIKFWKYNKTEKQFIPHPSTWINQKRWEDELDLPKTIKQESKDIKQEIIKKRKEDAKLEADSPTRKEKMEMLSGFLNKKRKWKQT